MKKLLILLMMASTQILTAAPALVQDAQLLSKKLPNGMEIAVYKNSEPPNRVSMRLLVKRGSVYETESERGLAHFIEHMAFNGTKHFPAGDMVEYFQRLGMAFGADTNAHTSFTETVYKLDMPEVSEKLLTDGLNLLRDYCDGILFEEKAIDRERGIIIAEKKSRDDQNYRVAVKEIALLFKGTKFPDRMPIGEESVINGANRDAFLNFYRQNYRPENTVLVIVGDVDAQKILADAEKVFADWKDFPGAPTREDNFGELEKSSQKFSFSKPITDFDIVDDCTPNAPKSYASISASKPAATGDSYEKRAFTCRLSVAADALSTRYLRVADLPSSKITSGSASTFEFDKFFRTFSLSADAPAGAAQSALEENFRQLASLANLADSEIENAKKKYFEYLESAIKAKPTRKNPSLANSICSSFSEGAIYNSPENDLEIAKAALEGFDAKAALELVKSFFDGAKIKIFLSDTNAEPTQEKLRGIAAAAQSAAMQSPYAADIFKTDAIKFSEFSDPAKIASQTRADDLGIAQIVFENGVRLNVKSTDFSKDEVLMKISFGDGMLDVPAKRPELFTAVYALLAGGTKFQSVGEISAAQNLLKMSLNAGVDGNSFYIGTSSSRKDFDTAVKLAATMVADAGFRKDGEEALAKFGDAFYRNYESDPRARLNFAVYKLFAKPEIKIPGTREGFSKIGMEDVGKWLKPILKNSYMEISIVGDVSESDALELVKSTFGTLPQRKATMEAPYAKIEFVKEASSFEINYKTDDEPRSIAVKMWMSGGREDVKAMRAANILGAVLDDVLRKNVREKQGKVYSPAAYNNSSQWIKDAGFMTALSMVEPKYNAELLKDIDECAAEVVKNITQDEFERAKIPLTKAIAANKRRNAYWLAAFVDLSQARPVNLELARTLESGYESVTLDDVRKQAEKIFASPPYTISITPQK